MSQSKDVKISLGSGSSDKLPINPFSLSQFVAHPAIVMIAKRGSGKSWVVRAILDYFKDIPVGLVISPTDRMSCFYGDFFSDTYIFYDYDTEIIQKVLNRQKMIIDKNKQRLKIGKKQIDTRSFVVMDDCLGQRGAWIKDKPIQELLFNGRHYHVMYILTMQFPLGITPQLRANFDYVFLLADDTVSNLKRIYDHYAGIFPTFDSFKQVFSQLTADFGSMVLVNRGVRSSFLQKVYYYVAPDLSHLKLDDAKIGCAQFRNYHKQNYNNNWRIKGGGEFNADEFLLRKKNNKSMVIVDKIKMDDDNITGTKNKPTNKNKKIKKKKEYSDT
jgi:hypothetical protein